jgi:hypothetical protein
MWLLILVIIFLLIVFTPYIIRSDFTVIEEQLVEGATIVLLFIVGYAVLSLYRKEVARNISELNRLKQDKGALENRLTEAFKYIGAVNIQIQEIKTVFSEIRKFPENKKDFGRILHLLAGRTLNMVNSDWVLFRIINTKNLDTLGEHIETRGDSEPPKCKISNKILLSKKKLTESATVSSGHENFYIKTFCIIPKAELSDENNIFITAVVNQLEMLFLIFNSIYYKDADFKKRNLSGP